MNKPMKNGKLPVSSQKEVDQVAEYQEMSMTDVDPAVRAHLEASGRTIRWINATKHKAAGGFNQKGWQPVRISDLPSALTAATYGATAEGFLVRNDMMLASRPKEVSDRHEKQLKQKAALAAGKSQVNAQAIKEGLGRYGKVIEGYEENSDD